MSSFFHIFLLKNDDFNRAADSSAHFFFSFFVIFWG